MHVVHARQPFPEAWSTAIFLAGPTPRHPEVSSWRPAALEHLERMGYEGVVFVPEDADGQVRGEYDDQVGWERDALRFADQIVFWVPRDLVTLPGFTTNVELGRWAGSEKVVLGYPEGAPKTRYLDWMAKETGAPVRHSLEATLETALRRVRPALRHGGERHVPAHLWHTPSFQAWYGALRAAGNRLDDAEALWQARVGLEGQVFAWILKVVVWVEAEGRHKRNEWIHARTDISSVVLHRTRPDPLDSEIVLVREFRSAVRNADGFVHELPGGSAPTEGVDPLRVAAEEVHEETGLAIAGERLRPLGVRQLVAPLSTHVAHVYAAELTDAELEQARALAAAGTPHGAGGSERTVVEVTTVRALLADERVDWATTGMVMRAVTG